MANALSVRRVSVCTIDKKGHPVDVPMFGVMAADDYAQVYNDTFASIDDLNATINQAKSILAVVDPDGEYFPEADHCKIGHDNFYGKDWQRERTI